jgi:hypothetical protein
MADGFRRKIHAPKKRYRREADAAHLEQWPGVHWIKAHPI